ncbi:unnamed protein product [Protopolystoma xenopodis]|uniref:Uncharacterized protein n=1 Tax=Protopolystoma xenopodis TaxID=117903 RepID=A0A448XDD6_9PLAT|nr:unnamed protein product [Protopolystoma xenopodis]
MGNDTLPFWHTLIPFACVFHSSRRCHPKFGALKVYAGQGLFASYQSARHRGNWLFKQHGRVVKAISIHVSRAALPTIVVVSHFRT